ncbi:hypothetical protein AB4Z19_15470 [Pseudoduganella sp. RAF19]
MNQQSNQQQEQSAVGGAPFDPGHVMAREHYERLAREAAEANQK